MMILDTQTISAGLEKWSKHRPIPGSGDVILFLKASFLGEKEFIEFCRTQTVFCNYKKLLDI